MTAQEAGARLGAVFDHLISLSIRLLQFAWRLISGVALRLWRGLARITRPAREFLWRWWRYSFREPLAIPEEAHETLRTLCGYRLVGGPHKIVRVVPGLRRLRFGVWMTVQTERQSSSHWTTRWVRWIDDPVEVWLVRSAIRGAEPGQPSAKAKKARGQVEPEKGLLERMSDEEMESLLGKR